MLTHEDLKQIAKTVEGVVAPRFDRLEKKIANEVCGLIQTAVIPQLDALYTGLESVDGRLKKVEATMVTKDYLHEVLTTKLFDLRGDLVILMRKEDTKVKALIEILKKRKLLQPEDVSYLSSLEPFAV